MSDPTVDARLALALERLAQAQRAHLQVVATEHRLSPLQVLILDTLAAGSPPEPRTRALALELDVRQPTLTEAVNALVAKGLVVRRTDPADRRRTTFELTGEGRIRAARLAVASSPLEDAVARVPDEAKRDLLETLLLVIDELHGAGVLGIARTCTSCGHLRVRKGERRCDLLDVRLRRRDLRVDCETHVPAAAR